MFLSLIWFKSISILFIECATWQKLMLSHIKSLLIYIYIYIYIYLDDYCIGNCMSSHWSGKLGINKSIHSQGGGKWPIPSSTRFIEYGRKRTQIVLLLLIGSTQRIIQLADIMALMDHTSGWWQCIDFPILCKGKLLGTPGVL